VGIEGGVRGGGGQEEASDKGLTSKSLEGREGILPVSRWLGYYNDTATLLPCSCNVSCRYTSWTPPASYTPMHRVALPLMTFLIPLTPTLPHLRTTLMDLTSPIKLCTPPVRQTLHPYLMSLKIFMATPSQLLPVTQWPRPLSLTPLFSFVPISRNLLHPLLSFPITVSSPASLTGEGLRSSSATPLRYPSSLGSTMWFGASIEVGVG
jgi:hypothetical protein